MVMIFYNQLKINFRMWEHVSVDWFLYCISQLWHSLALSKLVWECVKPIRWRNSRITSAMQWGPLSDRSWWGAPKRPKCLRRNSAADKAVASVVWYNSTHRVKVSTMTRIYPWSGNEHVENSNPCSWFYNLDIHSNGMFEYRFHRSISGSRIYPCHSRHFHSMGRIV